MASAGSELCTDYVRWLPTWLPVRLSLRLSWVVHQRGAPPHGWAMTLSRQNSKATVLARLDVEGGEGGHRIHSDGASSGCHAPAAGRCNDEGGMVVARWPLVKP
jgi:hypothetical protein